MNLTVTAQDIARAEGYLAAGDIESALPQLQELTGAVEDWAAETCVDTKDRQWFSFDDAFERLAYRRVEKDPRELVQVEVPLARLYSDLAFARIRQEDFAAARDALMQAVRWNPMNCGYRLDLAEVCRILGDVQEWAALSFSVLARASDARSAGLAYANLGQLFLNENDGVAALGCARLAQSLASGEQRVTRLMNSVGKTHPEALSATEDALTRQLGMQGIPTEPSAEIAVCLLMCASDAAREGDTKAATDFTVRARNLVGADNAKALIQLINESDAELAAEKEAGERGEAAAHAVGQPDTAVPVAPVGEDA